MSSGAELVDAWLRGAARDEAPEGLGDALGRVCVRQDRPGFDAVGLAEAIGRACTRARHDRPGIALDDTELAQAIGSALADHADPIAGAGEVVVGDLALARACANGDRSALGELDRVLAALRPTLARMGADAATIDELMQQHRSRLLTAEPDRPPRILGFRGHSDLRRWLKVALVRDAVRALQRRPTHAEDDELDVLMDPDADPELRVMQDSYRADFRHAFAHALAELPPRDRNVLRYHLLEGLAIDDIGAIYRVHRATAARWLVRIRERLHASTRAELMRTLAIGPTELDSVMRLIRSRLDASITDRLGEPPTS